MHIPAFKDEGLSSRPCEGDDTPSAVVTITLKPLSRSTSLALESRR
jgi:hypothetical protein